MNQLKTQVYTDAKLDLSLYIEGLLEVDEPVQIVEQVIATPVSEPVKEPSPQPSLPREFDCLQVTIGELPFLIPTAHIRQVKKINQPITRLPVEGNAFLGLLKLAHRSLAVIDLITLVCENNSSKSKINMEVRDNFIQHILLMEPGNYAITCDKPGALCKITRDDIHVSNMKKGPGFYHGIARSRLCPVINMEMVEATIARMPFIQSLGSTANHCQ